MSLKMSPTGLGAGIDKRKSTFQQRGALVAPPARSSTRFDFCNKIFDQLYLQLAPADHLVLLTRMLVAEFLYRLLDAASHGR